MGHLDAMKDNERKLKHKCYECNLVFCSQKLKNVYNKKHSNTSGECGESFSRSSSLVRHAMNHQ